MTWLYALKAANLLSKDISTIQKAVKAGRFKGRYISGIGRGGRVLQIALESLPQEAQDRYWGKELEPTPIDGLTADQMEDANFKQGCVSEYLRSGLSPQDYIDLHNAQQPEKPITLNQLFRWQRIIKNGGGWAELADKRGGHNKGRWSMSDEAWEDFCALYYTQQKRTAQRCWEFTQRIHPNIPTVDAFLRRIKAEIPKLMEIETREGPTAMRDSLPSMTRDRRVLDSNDVWVSDHHKMDVFVRNKKGRAVRPWFTVFVDERSRRIMKAVLREADPNATVIKQCLRGAIEENETTPLEVYFDNGADYRSKYFRRDFPLSLVNQLGIGTIYATPYHGQAKSAERLFGTLESQFGKMWPTYAGKDAKNRPECMRVSNEKIAEMAPEWDVFEAALLDYVKEYNHRLHTGQAMDNKCPEEVYFENLTVKRIVRDHDALRLLCGISEKRTVQKNGVNIRSNNYFNTILLNYIGKDVIVTFDPDKTDQVAVFDMDNNAICMAQAKILAPFRGTTDEDYISAQKERKAAYKVSKQHQIGREFSVHELIALRQLEEKQYSESGEVTTVEHLTAKATRNSQILKENPASERRPASDDDVTAILHKRYDRINATGG